MRARWGRNEEADIKRRSCDLSHLCLLISASSLPHHFCFWSRWGQNEGEVMQNWLSCQYPLVSSPHLYLIGWEGLHDNRLILASFHPLPLGLLHVCPILASSWPRSLGIFILTQILCFWLVETGSKMRRLEEEAKMRLIWGWDDA